MDVLLEMSSEAAGAAQAALPDDFLRPPSYFRIVRVLVGRACIRPITNGAAVWLA